MKEAVFPPPRVFLIYPRCDERQKVDLHQQGKDSLWKSQVASITRQVIKEC